MPRWTVLLAVLWLGFAHARAAHGDELRLNPEGLKHVEEITRKIAPASIAAGDRWKFIRCLILEAHPGDAAATPDALDHWVSYTAVCYDLGGANASAPVRLSAKWVRPMVNSVDTFMDLRTLASNRDEVYGTRIGSPVYVAGVLRALGVKRSGLPEPPPDTDALEPGRLELRLHDEIPSPMEWHRLVMERTKRRLPLINCSRILQGGHELADVVLLHPIAKARRYGFYESGFDRAAMRVLAMRSEFVGTEGSSALAMRLADEGRSVFQTLLLRIRDAAPSSLSPAEKVSHREAIDAILASTDDEALVAERVSEYWRAKRETVESWDGSGGDLPVDPSELALVALEVLLASDGVFRADEESREFLLNVLVQLGTDIGIDIRAEDAVDPRPVGLRLMHRLLDPEARSTGVPRAQVEESARTYRALLRPLQNPDSGSSRGLRGAVRGLWNLGEWRYKLKVMAIVGWEADDRTLARVRELGWDAERFEQESRDDNMSTGRRAWAGRSFEIVMRQLADLHALSAVDRDAERIIAAEVEAHFAKLRAIEKPGESSRNVLRRWQELRGR